MNTTALPPLPYRGDIDGLRAIAILAVVLFQFGLPLSGGFVGVDVFFVISGYVIGGLLWRDYDATGRIAFAAFCIRRIRRLAPAYFVVLLGTTALGWALLLPDAFRNHGEAVIASVLYLPNVLAFRQGGGDGPLAHLWTLGIAAQFYLLLPLIMILLARWRWGIICVIASLWALSLLACVWMTPLSPNAAFYLLPFRAWEMLSGVLLAIWGQARGAQWRGHPALSSVGITMLGASILFVPAGPLFPGLLAIPPVIGTLLLLSSGRADSPVNRLLTHPAMRSLGMMSYALYLWHWPVFALAQTLRGDMIWPEAMIWMALALGLSWMTWRYVEQPPRHARNLTGRGVFAGLLLASLAALALGGTLIARDGLPSRFGPDTRMFLAVSEQDLDALPPCKTAETGPLSGLEICAIGPAGPPEVLIWGDSHARALQAGLDRAASDTGVPAIMVARDGCPPLFGLRKIDNQTTAAQDAACTRANKQIRQALGSMPGLRSVLLVGRWSYYATGEGVGLDAARQIGLFPTDRPASTDLSQPRLLTQAARTTVTDLARLVGRVQVLRQPPEIPMYDSRIAARESALSGMLLVSAPITSTSVLADEIILRTTLSDAPWLPLAGKGAVTLLDTWPMFCTAGKCLAVQDGQVLYQDNNRMTHLASVRLRDTLRPVFE